MGAAGTLAPSANTTKSSVRAVAIDGVVLRWFLEVISKIKKASFRGRYDREILACSAANRDVSLSFDMTGYF